MERLKALPQFCYRSFFPLAGWFRPLATLLTGEGMRFKGQWSSTFPLAEGPRGDPAEPLPLSFPPSVALLHSSQDALCGGCGPWPLAGPLTHSGLTSGTGTSPLLKAHTVNKILQLSHRCYSSYLICLFFLLFHPSCLFSLHSYWSSFFLSFFLSCYKTNIFEAVAWKNQFQRVSSGSDII